METVFSMWFVPKCYEQGQLSSGVDSSQLAVAVERIARVQLQDIRWTGKT
jgi:hypothetical protein